MIKHEERFSHGIHDTFCIFTGKLSNLVSLFPAGDICKGHNNPANHILQSPVWENPQ